MAFLVSTTGTVQTVVFDDLDGRWITHPTVDLDLSVEFSTVELVNSTSVQQALDNGWITVKDNKGNQINSSGGLSLFFVPHEIKAHEDVNIVLPSDKNILVYNANIGLWENKTAYEAGLSEIGHTHQYQAIEFSHVFASNTFITTSTGYTFLSGMELAVSITGNYFVEFEGVFKLSSNSEKEISIVIYKNNSIVSYSERIMYIKKKNKRYTLSTSCIVENVASGDVFRLYWKTQGGALNVMQRYMKYIRLS